MSEGGNTWWFGLLVCVCVVFRGNQVHAASEASQGLGQACSTPVVLNLGWIEPEGGGSSSVPLPEDSATAATKNSSGNTVNDW